MSAHEIKFFSVDGRYYGGDQHWGRTWIMRIGGCSTVTACDQVICLARNSYAMRDLFPFDSTDVAKEQFLALFEEMFHFVRPGVQGLTDIQKYANGIKEFAQTRGVLLSHNSLSGDEDVSRAAQFTRDNIDAGRPVAYLMLNHRNREFEDFKWHWFSLTGYEDTSRGIDVIAATYGRRHRLNLRAAWDTGYCRKGGLVSMIPEALYTESLHHMPMAVQ